MLALVAMRLAPPFSSPDENSHLLRADMISHGQWRLAQAPPGLPPELGGMGGQVDEGFLRYVLQALQTQFSTTRLTELVLGSTPLLTPESRQALRKAGQVAQWANTTVFATASGTNYYNPLIYIPHAAALWLARHAGLSMAASHDLVRLTTFLLCLILAVTAVRLLQFPPVALGLVTTPMALFQWLAPTIDGLTAGLTLLALALFLTECARPAGQRSVARAALLGAAVALVATTRIHMLPLLALPLFLAMRQRVAGWWALALATCIGTFAWFGWALASTIDTRVQRSHSTVEIVSFYLRDPGSFAALLWRTLADADTRRFYAQSFIGNLGWLDAPVSTGHAVALALALMALLTVSLLQWQRARATRPISKDARLAAWLLPFVGLACMLLSFMALAVAWNDHPARTIQGMQGRYFILPLLVVACALWDGRGRTTPATAQPASAAQGLPPPRLRRVGWWMLGVFGGYAYVVLAATLAVRYP